MITWDKRQSIKIKSNQTYHRILTLDNMPNVEDEILSSSILLDEYPYVFYNNHNWIQQVHRNRSIHLYILLWNENDFLLTHRRLLQQLDFIIHQSHFDINQPYFWQKVLKYQFNVLVILRNRMKVMNTFNY